MYDLSQMLALPNYTAREGSTTVMKHNIKHVEENHFKREKFWLHLLISSRLYIKFQ